MIDGLKSKGIDMGMLEGLKRSQLWWALAIEEIRSRYARSFLGIGWIFLSFAGFVFVKILVFSQLSTENVSYFSSYVTIGFFVWNYISISLIDGSTTFTSAKNWIQGAAVPLSVFVYKVVARNVVLNVINIAVVFLVLAVMQPTITWMALWSLPFLLLVVLNAIWVTFLFATIGARFRDLQHLMNTMVRVLLFVTPIFWTPESMGALWNYLIFNPFAHYLILVREPVLNGTIPMLSLIVVLSLTVVGWLAAITTFIYSRNRVVFWL